jgi:hypothetical protein
MLNIFYKNTYNRVICLFLTAVFLSSFPAGATALVVCLDEDENHIVAPNFYLADCHSSVDAGLLLSDEYCSALAEKENNDCVDVSLTNANTLNRPSRVMLPGIAKTIVFYTQPSRLIGFQQQVAGNSSSALFQHLFTLTQANPLRTVVLLI